MVVTSCCCRSPYPHDCILLGNRCPRSLQADGPLAALHTAFQFSAEKRHGIHAVWVLAVLANETGQPCRAGGFEVGHEQKYLGDGSLSFREAIICVSYVQSSKSVKAFVTSLLLCSTSCTWYIFESDEFRSPTCSTVFVIGQRSEPKGEEAYSQGKDAWKVSSREALPHCDRGPQEPLRYEKFPRIRE